MSYSDRRRRGQGYSTDSNRTRQTASDAAQRFDPFEGYAWSEGQHGTSLQQLTRIQHSRNEQLQDASSPRTATGPDMLSERFAAMTTHNTTGQVSSQRPSSSSIWNASSSRPVMPTSDGVQGRDYDPSNYVRRPKKFFDKSGRVIVVMWSEPAGAGSRSTAHIAPGSHGFLVHQIARQFIVLKGYEQHCLAIGIKILSKRDAARSRDKHQYGIVYHRLENQMPSPEDEGMQPIAIRVLPDLKTDTLDPRCRIDYSKIYTIEYDVPVRAFGMVTPETLPSLFSQYSNVNSLGQTAASAAVSPRPVPAVQSSGATLQPSPVSASGTQLNADQVRALLARMITESGLSQEQAILRLRHLIDSGRIQVVNGQNDNTRNNQVANQAQAEDDTEDEDDDEDDEDNNSNDSHEELYR